MRARIGYGIALVVFSLVMLAGIALSLAYRPSMKEAIVGKWQLGGSDQTLLFEKGGLVIASQGTVKTVGLYEFLDDKVVRISWHKQSWGINPEEGVEYEAKVSGNTLTLMGQNTQMYYRIK